MPIFIRSEATCANIDVSYLVSNSSKIGRGR